MNELYYIVILKNKQSMDLDGKCTLIKWGDGVLKCYKEENAEEKLLLLVPLENILYVKRNIL